MQIDDKGNVSMTFQELENERTFYFKAGKIQANLNFEKVYEPSIQAVAALLMELTESKKASDFDEEYVDYIPNLTKEEIYNKAMEVAALLVRLKQ